jgi:hypothetical protein
LAYPNCARLCVEEDAAVVYHSMANPRLMAMKGEVDVDEELGSEAMERKQLSGVLMFPMDYACALEVRK